MFEFKSKLDEELVNEAILRVKSLPAIKAPLLFKVANGESIVRLFLAKIVELVAKDPMLDDEPVAESDDDPFNNLFLLATPK